MTNKKGLFEEQISRKPDNYPWASDFMEAIWAGHWTASEFNFMADYAQFKNELTDEQREMIVRTLSAIGQIEIAVKTFWSNLGNTLPQPSIRDLGYVMGANEVVHNKAYEKLLDVLGLDHVFEENMKNPIIKGRVNYLRKYSEKVYTKNQRKQFIYALALFTMFVEGVSLFSQFYIIKHLNKKSGLLKDTAQQVSYTQAEEACFTDDVELMTPCGWKKMTDVKIGDEVFQYNEDGSITKTFVLGVVNRPYEGKIYRVARRNSEVNVTPDHSMIYYNTNGELIRREAQHMKYHNQTHIPTRAYYNNSGVQELSAVEKLYIAVQADGSKYNTSNGGATYQISATKQRKIDRLREILKQSDIKYSEIARFDKNKGKNYTTFDLYYDGDLDLKKFDWVDVSDKSINWCKEFCYELAQWDGNTSKSGTLSYCSKDKSNIDVSVLVGTLAGYRVATSHKVDNRSDTFNDTWRVNFNTGNDKPKSHSIENDIYDYSGNITCVNVPSGNIIVRHPNHDPFIVGNCHLQIGVKLINTLRQEYPELFDDELITKIKEECREAIDHERKVIAWILGDVNEPDLNVDILDNFVRKKIASAMEQIGILDHGIHYDKDIAAQTRWFDESSSGVTLTDFFASRPVEYVKGSAVEVDDLF